MKESAHIPKANYNIIFIKNERAQDSAEVGGTKKTIVYVLNKKQTERERIEGTNENEVYYISYDGDENPLLPHGERLHTELNQTSDEYKTGSGFAEDAPSTTHAKADSYAGMNALEPPQLEVLPWN